MKALYIIFTLLVANVISQECETGTFPYQCKTCDPNNSTLCGTCNSGDYLKEGKCYNCYEKMIGCAICSTEKKCDSCEAQFVLENNTCTPAFKKIPECDKYNNTNTTKIKVCSNCVPGFFLDKNKTACNRCGDNCLKCTNSTHCEICNPNYYLNKSKCFKYPDHCSEYNVTKLKCTNCIASYFLKDNKCEACPNNCTKCESSDKCQICNSGFVLENDKCVACSVNNCTTCVEGDHTKCSACNVSFKLEGGACKKCNVLNCSQCSDQNQTYFLNANEKCDICSPKFYIKDTKCEKCNDTNCLICENEGKTCKSCDSGFYLKVGNETCLNCKNKYKNCSSCHDYTCDSCDEGFMKLKVNCAKADKIVPHCISSSGCACSECEKNYFLYSSVNCLKNITNCTEYNTTGCSKCKTNFTLTQEKTCVNTINNCKTYKGNECIECYRNFTLVDHHHCVQNVTNCAKYNVTGCIECNKGFRLGNNQTVCIKSASGYLKVSVLLLLFAFLFI